MTVSSAVASAPALPDVNRESHPFEAVQRALDRVAYFGLYAVPAPRLEDGWLTPSDRADYFGLNGGYGIEVRSDLHRFDTRIEGPGRGGAPGVSQEVGEKVGELRSKLLVSRGEPAWEPGIEPRALFLDVWRREYFVMLDTSVSFSGGSDALQGYGIGRTFPIMVRGRPALAACAVGNLFGGRGKLAGSAGTLVLNGTITAALGFQGSVSCRIPDPAGVLHHQAGGAGIPGMRPLDARRQERLWADDPATYVCLRGEKASPSVRTEYGPPPGGGRVSLVTPAVMKTVRFESSGDTRSGLATEMVVGRRVAELLAAVELDVLAPPGTPEAPGLFTTRNVYDFLGPDGRAVGSVTADIELGRSFGLELGGLPGQSAMRYGGFGCVVGGTGPFEGLLGTLSVNSAIGVAPHALSMLNVLRIVDPDRSLQATGASSPGVASWGPAGGRWERSFPEVSRIRYMFDPPTSRPPAVQQAEPVSAPAPAPPDLNAETHPFDRVLAELDRATFLEVVCRPAGAPEVSRARAGGGVSGLAMTGRLHRLDVGLDLSGSRAVRATNVAGGVVGSLSQRWAFIPDDFHAAPGGTPPATELDSRRGQRFAMLDATCSFGSGSDGFRGFGTGATFPVSTGGRGELLVAAVGNVTGGSGRLRGATGTYVLSGRLSTERGFEGNVLVRVTDPDPALRVPSVPPVEHPAEAVPGLTLVVLRGQKASAGDRTELLTDSGGRPIGFALKQELREVRMGLSVEDGLRAAVSFGRVVGGMESAVHLDLASLSTPGTGDAPVPFTTRNRFTLVDGAGHEVGSFVAEGGEGRTFDLRLPRLPGQKALRFGAFQRLSEGTGAFSGIAGLLTDNSAVGVAPHATATLYTLCIVDPDGRFRAGLG